jgi:hypothetical protein
MDSTLPAAEVEDGLWIFAVHVVSLHASISLGG